MAAFSSVALVAVLASAERAPAQSNDSAVAPVGSKPAAEAPPRPRVLDDPIGAEDRARAARALNPDGPFQASGVWLPPFYLADARQSVKWVGLLYLQVTDFEANTRTQMLPPLYLYLADAQSRTLVSPLYGKRSDGEGDAGYIGNYAWRRDRLTDSDVVFPFYWSFRERDFEGGPDARRSGALAPFVFWQRDTSGRHWTFAPPLVWQWGDSQESRTIAGNVYHFEEPGRTRFGVFPFYFAGRDADSSYHLLLNTFYSSTATSWGLASVPFVFAGSDGTDSFACVPPALFFKRSGPTSSTWVAGPAYHHASETGSYTGVAPLWFQFA
ncbi:MAG: hypothetical protein ACAI25_08715, partial [Planctomycetota bacterium]